MKENTNNWLMQKADLAETLAVGVVYPDRTSFAQIFAEISGLSTEKIWTCLGDMMHGLHTHRLPVRRVRWFFANAIIHAVIRTDGACLAVVTIKEMTTSGQETVDRLMAEFLAL